MTNEAAKSRTPEQAFAARFREFRKAKGLTQEQVAEMATEAGVRIRQPQMQKLEVGRRPISLDEATTLAGVLGLTLQDLMPSPTKKESAARSRQVLAELDALAPEATAAAAALREAEARNTKVRTQIELLMAQLRELTHEMEGP